MGLENWIRRIIRDEVKVRGCAAYGSLQPIPFDKVADTQIPLDLTGEDPDDFFTTDAAGTRLVIPQGLGGRYILLGRLDWSKETQDPGAGHYPHWTLENANSGKLYAYPALGGDPSHPLPGSRMAASPVAHARHTWQQFHWEGILNEGDELQFFAQQSVSTGETHEYPPGEVTAIEVQAVVTLDIRRPGIQY